MTVCTSCQSGRHSHDTWGPNAPEVRRGEYRIGDDAGCPNLADGGDISALVDWQMRESPATQREQRRQGSAARWNWREA